MAISARCSLNLSPPPPSSCSGHALSSNSSSTSRTTTQISWWGSEKWRNQCAVSLASSCMIIGLQMGDASAIVAERPVIAKNHTHMDMQLFAEPSSYEKAVSTAKWSDRRMCPSWQTKSFEIIVPENLPRPSARRRWEDIGFTKQNAPAVKVAVRNDCFSM